MTTKICTLTIVVDKERSIHCQAGHDELFIHNTIMQSLSESSITWYVCKLSIVVFCSKLLRLNYDRPFNAHSLLTQCKRNITWIDPLSALTSQ